MQQNPFKSKVVPRYLHMSLIQVYRVYQYCNNSLKEIPCNPLDINEIERLLITYGKIKLPLPQKVIKYLMIDLDWTYRSLLYM